MPQLRRRNLPGRHGQHNLRKVQRRLLRVLNGSGLVGRGVFPTVPPLHVLQGGWRHERRHLHHMPFPHAGPVRCQHRAVQLLLQFCGGLLLLGKVLLLGESPGMRLVPCRLRVPEQPAHSVPSWSVVRTTVLHVPNVRGWEVLCNLQIDCLRELCGGLLPAADGEGYVRALRCRHVQRFHG